MPPIIPQPPARLRATEDIFSDENFSFGQAAGDVRFSASVLLVVVIDEVELIVGILSELGEV